MGFKLLVATGYNVKCVCIDVLGHCSFSRRVFVVPWAFFYVSSIFFFFLWVCLGRCVCGLAFHKILLSFRFLPWLAFVVKSLSFRFNPGCPRGKSYCHFVSFLAGIACGFPVIFVVLYGSSCGAIRSSLSLGRYYNVHRFPGAWFAWESCFRGEGIHVFSGRCYFRVGLHFRGRILFCNLEP